MSPWRSRAATLLAELGASDEAAALAREELQLARAFGAPRAIGVALRVAGAVGAQPPLPALKEAVAVLEETPARLELARALVDLGAAQRRGGQRSAAREPLARGLDLAHALRRRAPDDPRARGAAGRRRAAPADRAQRPRRAHPERAARRRAGRERPDQPRIAQQLFVTEKTVEAHLRGAFQKLDISSRTRLAQALT